jgi:hypothetical protein
MRSPVRPVQTPHTTDLLSLISDYVKYSFKKMITVTVQEEVQVHGDSCSVPFDDEITG